MFSFISPIPIIVTFVTGFGVLVHDMHIDRMTTVAVGLPAIVASYGVASGMIKSSDHTHVERVSFQKNLTLATSSTLPKIQPREDARRYIQNKKVYLSGGGEHAYIWPSV